MDTIGIGSLDSFCVSWMQLDRKDRFGSKGIYLVARCTGRNAKDCNGLPWTRIKRVAKDRPGSGWMRMEDF